MVALQVAKSLSLRWCDPTPALPVGEGDLIARKNIVINWNYLHPVPLSLERAGERFYNPQFLLTQKMMLFAAKYNVSSMTLFEKLKQVRSEEDVKDAYIKALGLKGVSKRAAFVIDEEGKVAYAEVLEDAHELPDFKAIDDALKA